MSQSNDSEYSTLPNRLYGMKRRAGVQFVQIGDRVIVESEWGSHSGRFESTITWICETDESGFTIGVAMPTFWGTPLFGLRHDGAGWHIAIKPENKPMQFLRITGLHFGQEQAAQHHVLDKR